MLTSLEAAKVLCQESEWSCSNLRLNKLIYIAHMVHLGTQDGKPLIREEFEAWTYGPVLPNLYQEAKIFGSGSVKNIFHRVRDVKNDSEEYDSEIAVLVWTYDQMGSWSGGKLVALTHRETGAWYKHYEPGYKNIVISNDSIAEEFDELFDAQ